MFAALTCGVCTMVQEGVVVTAGEPTSCSMCESPVCWTCPDLTCAYVVGHHDSAYAPGGGGGGGGGPQRASCAVCASVHAIVAARMADAAARGEDSSIDVESHAVWVHVAAALRENAGSVAAAAAHAAQIEAAKAVAAAAGRGGGLGAAAATHLMQTGTMDWTPT